MSDWILIGLFYHFVAIWTISDLSDAVPKMSPRHGALIAIFWPVWVLSLIFTGLFSRELK